MSKSKVNVKSKYEIKKVRKVMRMKDNNFEPATYEVYKVSSPNGFKKTLRPPPPPSPPPAL